jgi:hypothetical protein
VPVYAKNSPILHLYNAEQTSKPNAITKFAQYYTPFETGVTTQSRNATYEPMDGLTGCPFPNPKFRHILQNTAKAKEYLSPFWVSHEQLKETFGDSITIKEGEEGVMDASTNTQGVKWGDTQTDPSSSEAVWFNAEQTSSPEAIKARALRGAVAMSGKTGKAFAHECQEVLQAAAAESKYKSRYWVTEGQLSTFHPPLQVLPGEVGIVLELTDFKTKQKRQILCFNAEQTTGPEIILHHVTSK